MDTSRILIVGGLLLVVGSVAVTLDPGLVVGEAGEYNRTTVTAYGEDGTELATVDVRIADTFDKQYTGLSETESLSMGEGMLFVHDAETEHSYVMRNMSFPIDIVFLDSNGTVTAIFHAGVEGEDAPYTATGKYVLEVPRGWANETGVGLGDTVDIPADAA